MDSLGLLRRGKPPSDVPAPTNTAQLLKGFVLGVAVTCACLAVSAVSNRPMRDPLASFASPAAKATADPGATDATSEPGPISIVSETPGTTGDVVPGRHARSTLAVRAAEAEDPAGEHWNVTDTGEVCFQPAYELSGPNSDWHRLKVTPPPAPCTVRGLPIEALDPFFNFRRAFALGQLADKEDKTHLLPFLRAAHDPILSTRPRRVLLDLGGNLFNSSVLWFLRNYPLEFSEVHVFEAKPGLFQFPPREENGTCQAVTLNRESAVEDKSCLAVANEVLDRIHPYERLVSHQDNPGTNPVSVDITRFIKSELKLTRKDTLIVKMDVEGAEWNILPLWLQDDELPHIVDELFVEVHYNHESMYSYYWNTGPPRENATKLLQDLRSKGFYAHFWP